MANPACSLPKIRFSRRPSWLRFVASQPPQCLPWPNPVPVALLQKTKSKDSNRDILTPIKRRWKGSVLSNLTNALMTKQRKELNTSENAG